MDEIALHKKNKREHRVRNNKDYGKRFIEILEIIYAIIMACGVAIILGKLSEYYPNVSLDKWLSIIISIFVLIRFFFAPSKNIKMLVRRAKKLRLFIMPFDVLVLLAHSFIFYLMCLEVDKVEMFYFWFFILLAGNSIWLILIWLRLRKDEIPYKIIFKRKIPYITIWSINNLIFVLSFFIYFKKLDNWEIWFVLALLNSMIDLLITYPYYFED